MEKVQFLPLVTVEQLRPLLVPRFLATLEATDGWAVDGWGRPIEMRVNLKAPTGKHVMCLRSPGADGKF